MSRLSVFQSARARSLRALRDVVVALAALALLGAQAISTLHFVLVPHHLCAMHGVLEDGSASAGSARQAEHDGSRDRATADEAAAESHEACSVATRTEHTTLPARHAPEQVQICESLLPVAPAGVWLKPDRAALLAGAPKTSPPVRA